MNLQKMRCSLLILIYVLHFKQVFAETKNANKILNACPKSNSNQERFIENEKAGVNNSRDKEKLDQERFIENEKAGVNNSRAKEKLNQEAIINIAKRLQKYSKDLKCLIYAFRKCSTQNLESIKDKLEEKSKEIYKALWVLKNKIRELKYIIEIHGDKNNIKEYINGDLISSDITYFPDFTDSKASLPLIKTQEKIRKTFEFYLEVIKTFNELQNVSVKRESRGCIVFPK